MAMHRTLVLALLAVHQLLSRKESALMA